MVRTTRTGHTRAGGGVGYAYETCNDVSKTSGRVVFVLRVRNDCVREGNATRVDDLGTRGEESETIVPGFRH